MNHQRISSARRTTVWIVLCLGLSPACNARSETPVDAYKSFVRAVHKGDSKTAFAALSNQAQSTLRQRAKEISAASGGAIKDEPEALLIPSSAPREALSEVKLQQQDGNRAVITAAAGNRLQVPMVRESGAWKIDLSEFINSRASAKPLP